MPSAPARNPSVDNKAPRRDRSRRGEEMGEAQGLRTGAAVAGGLKAAAGAGPRYVSALERTELVKEWSCRPSIFSRLRPKA